jgi:hypothetical protein
VTENPIPIEEAEDYLLGRLKRAARSRFEARLGQDAALRRQLRELEEGALALAMSAPQLRPPREAWTNIQAAVTRKQQCGVLGPFLSLHWLANGWQVAGGLAVAVCLHLAAVHLSGAGQKPGQPGRAGQATEKIAMVAPSEKTRQAAMEKQDTAPSVAVARERTTRSPASSMAVAFAPARNEACREKEAAFAPEQEIISNHRRPIHGQRAVSLAKTLPASQTNSPEAQAPNLAAAQPSVQVDYVEFTNPVAMDSTGTVTLYSGIGGEEPTMAPAAPPIASNESISLDAAGNDLIVTIDPATLPANLGPITIWMVDAEGDQTLVGTVNLGVNPVVVDIQNADLGGDYEYTVIAGGTTVLGYFPQ